MKILELRFKNLNSLYGEWTIDFTHPEYESNGIFVLSGPTGAGKSTIMDAVCLALYGATPRLGKITKSSNEIMSRKTGESYSEVLFESQAGKFRCHWEQRRARKKIDGKLQDYEHQIFHESTGKLIETKKSLVPGLVEEKTGMDFDRFTRSILLAQGGFDTFLKADVEQKSKILEQITGTEIYSQISRRVHERQRDEKEKLNILNAETWGIVILEPEQEKEIKDNLESSQRKEAGLSEKLVETRKAIAWLNTIEDLKKEILILGDEAEKLKVEIEAFKPERSKLALAIKASSLEGIYATLQALLKQQADDQAALKTNELELPELEVCAGKQAEMLKISEQHSLKVKKALNDASPLIQKIRLLDQKIDQQAKVLSDNVVIWERESAKIEKNKQARRMRQKELYEANKDLQQSMDVLKELLGEKLLREYRAQKDTLLLEMAYIKKIEALEEHRSALIQGKPCPLCGSVEHPFTKINPPAPCKIEQKIEALTNMIGKAEVQEIQKTEIEKKITRMDSELKGLDTLIDNQVKELAVKHQDMEKLKQSILHDRADRKNLYGEKKTEEEEDRLKKHIAHAEKEEREARKLNVLWQKKLTTVQTHVEGLGKRITKRKPELKKTQALFLEALSSTDFPDEKSFLEARLSHKKMESLSCLANKLDSLKAGLKAKQKDRGMLLGKQIAKNLTDKTLDELEPHFEKIEKSLKELQDQIVGFKHRLNENKAAKEQMKAKQSAINKQKKESLRFEKLHALIGSADGKKYRNFAQGLTFELMVQQANQQLEKINDRYLLIRDKEQPLELNVLDNYQAGEIRSVKNLSGGESFIVSLALAIGLSRMASQRVKVDSLFLDEGFGSLDDDALEIALGTLSGLHQEGKLIGVISHVSALKNRIPTKIFVTPLADGRSYLGGPGCCKV